MKSSNVGKRCMYCCPDDELKVWTVGQVIDETENEYTLKFWSPFIDGDGMSEEFNLPKEYVILLS